MKFNNLNNLKSKLKNKKTYFCTSENKLLSKWEDLLIFFLQFFKVDIIKITYGDLKKIKNDDNLLTIDPNIYYQRASKFTLLYVINIDADNNSIVVGEKEYLEIKKIKLRELNILGLEKEFKDFINIKVRSTGRLLKAKINIKDNSADVEILDKETGISPGQACVFYKKNNLGYKVLGGGFIIL